MKKSDTKQFIRPYKTININNFLWESVTYTEGILITHIQIANIYVFRVELILTRTEYFANLARASLGGSVRAEWLLIPLLN